MEQDDEYTNVKIKEEPLDELHNISIKQEPVTPTKCTHHQHPPTQPSPLPEPSQLLQPPTQPSPLPEPSQLLQPPTQPLHKSAPLGRFSHNRSKTDKTVDLSSYRFGLYSYYAEGNRHEFDAPHFDPYYSENDIKDPALLARAKRSFQNLRNEATEPQEDYQIREESDPGGGRAHQPMYQRKRKKVRKLVVLVDKVPISNSMKEFLCNKYPPDSDRSSRWAMRQKCRNEFAPGTTPQFQAQESKLQEFLLQFQQPGSSSHQPKPYSHTNNQAFHVDDKVSPCSSGESDPLESTALQPNCNSSPKVPMPSYPPDSCDESNPAPSEGLTRSPRACNSAPLVPPENLIQRPPAYGNTRTRLEPPNSIGTPLTPDDSTITPSCDSSRIKQEPVETFCEHMKIKEEPIEYSISVEYSPAPPNLEYTDPPTLQVKREMLDSHNSENVTPNIPPNLPLPDQTQTIVRKKKKVFHPFATIKEEPMTVEEHQEHRNSECSENPEQQINSTQEENSESTETLQASDQVQVKQEPIDPQHLKMVEIFRKRVHKLRKIEVKPIASDQLPIKEEPMDFEDVAVNADDPSNDDFSMPHIKEEPVEPTLLVFDPKPAISRKSKTLNPKFVYGKRMNRARMSISKPKAHLHLDNEAEFDNAAKLSAPFSPPKSAWSQPATNVSKDDVNGGLTAEIDKLIQASNIESIDDTEKMCRIFAATITTVTDTKTNVFNLVLEKFKKQKLAEEENVEPLTESSSRSEETEADEPAKIDVLFPMTSQELYNQGISVISETKEPGNFELTQIKVEQEDIPSSETITETVTETVTETESPDKGKSLNQSQAGNQAIQQNPSEQDVLLEGELVIGETINENQNDVHHEEVIHSSDKHPLHHTPEKDHITPEKDHITPFRDIYKSPEANSHIPPTATIRTPGKQKSYKQDFYTSLHGEAGYSTVGTEATLSSKVRPQSRQISSESSLKHRDRPAFSEAERLFDEMIAEEQPPFHTPEEQAPFHAQENSYLEPFPRTDNLFPTSSLDDFIKAPLNTNEHLVKPKPSYVRLNYHETPESSEIMKPPTILFSSNTEDMTPKENTEWHNWHRQHERFDHFQNSGWTIEDQNSWSPQHSSWNDSCFEHPSSSSSSFEEQQKETTRINSYETNSLTSWIDTRRLPHHNSMPIIERMTSGEEIIRIPVEQRSIQTQHPSTNKFCPTFEAFLPFVMYVTQRQDAVKDVSIQTSGPPQYPPSWVGRPPARYVDSRPHSSVLVEPLLNGRRMQLHNKEAIIERNALGEEIVIKVPVQQRTIQTQYPDNKRIYSEFEASVPFITYVTRRMESMKHCSSQTVGAALFPPLVPPRRNRRHRPVLVEPLPNIEPIGDNVRTMRSSESYSILMEQIRTSNDPMFDKFMNSQKQPNGLVSKFNKYACYSPQANIPELPLTVNRSYSRKSSSMGKGKRPGIQYKEVSPQPYPPQHSNRGKTRLTPYQISVKIRKMGQVDNIIGRLSNKKRKDVSPKRAR